MQDSSQWMTVRQFADAAGVSPQAVYQRLDKDLSSYLKTEKKHKYINSDALGLFRLTSTCQEDSSTCQEVDKLDLIEKLDAMQAKLDSLTGNLTEARQAAAVAAAERDAERRRADENAATVAALTAALQSEQKHAAELTVLLQTANEQLTAALALNAGQIQLAMQQSEPAAVPTPAEDQQTDTKPGNGADDQSTGKRPGILARIFRKRKE